MIRRRDGFTLVELVIVILIGSLLVSIAMSSFQNAQNGFRVRGAKNQYATLQARARGQAIEMGQTVRLVVDIAGDSAFILSGGGITDVTNFRREMNVDLRTGSSLFIMCMTPRGYADPSCALAPNNPLKLEFWLNADSTSVTILPMGQLVGM